MTFNGCKTIVITMMMMMRRRRRMMMMMMAVLVLYLLPVIKLVDGTFYMMNCWFSYILILFRTAMLRSSWDAKAMRRPICNSRSKMKTRTHDPRTPFSCIWKVEWCRSATTAVQRMAFMEFWPQHIGMSIFILQIQSLFCFRWQV